MVEKNLLMEYLEYRCSVYYCLKTIFVKEATMAQIRQLIRSCKKMIELDDMPVKERAFVKYFASIQDAQVKEIREEMKPEYARLFLGPKQLVAPPYESVYRSCNRQMYGDETEHVRMFYENAGMMMQKKAKLPEDFIGIELEFMYWMSHRMYQALEQGQEEQAVKMAIYQYEFLIQHMIEWIPDFSKDIIEGTSMEYFKVSAAYLNEFIQEDMLFLKQWV